MRFKTVMKKTPFIVLFALLMFAAHSSAQVPDTLWTRTYGGTSAEAALAACETPDGSFLLAGYSDSAPAVGFDVYLARITGVGDTLWTRRIGGDGDDFARVIRKTDDGGFILAAMSNSFGHSNGDIWLLKLTATGDTVWTRWFGGSGYDDVTDIKLLSDGGLLIAGYSAAPGTATDGYAIRANASGDSLWTRRYGGAGEQRFQSVEALPDGGFILAGYSTISGNAGADMYVVRANAQGDTLWTRLIGNPTVQDQAVGAQPMSDGGYLIGGFTLATDSEQADFLAVSLSPTGATRWSHTYGGSYWDRAYVLRRASDGQFVLGGITNSYGAGNYDFYLLKIDSNGDTLWTKTVGGADNEFMYGLEAVRGGGYIEVGSTNSFGQGGNDLYAVRLGGFSGVGVVIRDETTGQPLANVWVSAVGLSYSGLTDAAGRYVLILPPDTIFDVLTYGPCTERDTVWNVAVIEDSLVEVNFDVERPVGEVPQTSLNIIVQNHETETVPLFIVNEGPGILDFSITAQMSDPPSAWLTVNPPRGSVIPGDTFFVAVTVAPDTTDDGTYDYSGDLSVRLNSCPDTLTHVSVIVMVLDAGVRADLLPKSFLLSAFPNPFNLTTTLEFALPRNERVTLKLYDVMGREVKTVVNEFVSAGVHRIAVDAAHLPSGFYLARMQTASVALTRKLLLLK